jgi:hypothetical protein
VHRRLVRCIKSGIRTGSPGSSRLDTGQDTSDASPSRVDEPAGQFRPPCLENDARQCHGELEEPGASSRQRRQAMGLSGSGPPVKSPPRRDEAVLDHSSVAGWTGCSEVSRPIRGAV